MSRRIPVFVLSLATALGLVVAGAGAAQARSVPNLTVSINHTSFVATQNALFRVHLGGPGGGQKVDLYRTLPSGTVQFDRTVTTDVHGNVSAAIPMIYNAYYTATWAGDSSWLPGRRATGKTKVTAYTDSHLSGTYGASGHYHLIHASKHGELDVFVFPSKAGQKVNFPLQSYYSGAWHTRVNNSYTLKAGSSDGVDYSISGTSFVAPKGYASRIRVEYHGDRYNYGVISGWYYVKFV